MNTLFTVIGWILFTTPAVAALFVLLLTIALYPVIGIPAAGAIFIVGFVAFKVAKSKKEN